MPTSTVTTLTPASIEMFRNWCIAKGQSENTAKAYSTDLRMLLAHYSTMSISDGEFQTKAQIWLNQTRRESAPKTTGRRLTSLRAFARWAKWATELNEYKAPQPSKTIPHPIGEGLDGLIRLEAVAANHEQQALVGACGYIGLRVGEALAFRTSWLNVHEMLLTVRGKGDKERIVPVSQRAWTSIAPAYIRAMQSDGMLIHYQDRSARKAITTLGKRAGLRAHIKSHDLRATYATILMEKGVNIRVIQELLGHANLATTEIYTGVGMASLKSAVEF